MIKLVNTWFRQRGSLKQSTLHSSGLDCLPMKCVLLRFWSNLSLVCFTEVTYGYSIPYVDLCPDGENNLLRFIRRPKPHATGNTSLCQMPQTALR